MIPTRKLVWNTAFLLLSASLLATGGHRAWAQTPSVVLQTLVSDLEAPVLLTHAGDGTHRKFIMEQGGRILVMLPTTGSTAVFLDIRGRVLSGGEQGLLGLAFHPQFASNRRFFVNYTRKPDGATVISEFQADGSDPNSANGSPEKILLVIAQPFSNHNGGMIAFGPDGFLYIGVGDGGSGNDPLNFAQNNDELLGKMLRIDVDHPLSESTPYSAPSSNPFFGLIPGRDEIFATGLRNPWRFSFDRVSGQLYAGDVGQGAIEEIDIVTRGGNYGWRVVEGTRCTLIDPAECGNTSFTGPIAEYDHSGGRCSVTGGYVYRGSQSSLPYGAYLFADYCTGEIFMLENGAKKLALDTTFLISSFGEDESGELYVVAHNGSIHRLTRNAPAGTPAITFSAPEGGGSMYASTVSNAAVKVGYARINSALGVAPAGLGTFLYRQDGVVVSEAAFAATPRISAGRIAVTTEGSTVTGIAFANPNTAPALVVFHFTNAAGQDFGAGSFTIPAGGQISRFLHETPFNAGPAPNGTLTFSATKPVAVSTLTITLNSRGAPLFSVLPVVNILGELSTPATLPHWVQGAGWSTEFLLVNPSNQEIRGVVELRAPDGQFRENLHYVIPQRSFRRITASTPESSLSSGYGKIVPSAGPAPAGAAIVRWTSGDVVVTETAIPAAPEGNIFRGYGEIVPGRRTGLAVANLTSSTASVAIALTPMDGRTATHTGMLQIPPFGQRSLFLDEIPGLEGIPAFMGRIQATSSATIAVTGLRTRINETGDFLITANAFTSESTAPVNADLFFPHLAVGGGYQMEFVLLNVKESGMEAGTLSFFGPDGRMLPLEILPIEVP